MADMWQIMRELGQNGEVKDGIWREKDMDGKKLNQLKRKLKSFMKKY